MAGRYTDEERLARGQYLKDGQWYTSSGYKIRNAGSTGQSSDTVRTYENEEAPASSSATDSASLRALRRRREEAIATARDAVRQAYVSRMLALRDLEQRLSASGYSGGMTDSAYLRLLSDYETTRRGILSQRDSAVAEYDDDIAAEAAALAAAGTAARQSGGTSISAAGGSTGTAKTTTAKTSTAKAAASKAGTTKTSTSKTSTAKTTTGKAKASTPTFADQLAAYRAAESEKVTQRLLNHELTQGQARILKNLLK